jgi:DNA-binding NarL/FixJ family response regulator
VRPEGGYPAESRNGHRAVKGDAERPLSIVVVDDHPFMREVISRMLRLQEKRYDVVAEAADVGTAFEACERLQPDMLILDINLPDGSGIDAVRRLKAASPRTRILLCTAYVTDDRVLDALRSGAHGFVEKTNTWQDFVDVIERVSRGENYFCSHTSMAVSELSQLARHHVELARSVALSPRESQVLKLVAQGGSSKEIAGKLSVSVSTVDVHRANVMKKLDLKNVAQLVAFAFHIDLIS